MNNKKIGFNKTVHAKVQKSINESIIFHHIKAFIGGEHDKFFYRPLFFGLKEFYNRKIRGFLGNLLNEGKV